VRFSNTHYNLVVKYSEILSWEFSNSQVSKQALYTKLVFPAMTLLRLSYISIKVGIIQYSFITGQFAPNPKETVIKPEKW